MRMHIGYIVSRYPAVSHTFIQREILALRKLGWTISTISIRPAAQRELLTDVDRDEARLTHTLLTGKTALSLKLFAAIFLTLLQKPAAFVRAAVTAWRIHPRGMRGAVWSGFYFLEALLVYRFCRQRGITHLHAHFANVACDVALLATILSSKPGLPAAFSFTMHGPTEFFDQHEHRLVEKVRAASFVICISDFCRSQLMAIMSPDDWHKLHVVHCGVAPEQFQLTRSQRHAAGDHVAADETRLLSVARLVPVKGHCVLLQALAEVHMRGHRATLTLIGDGPLRASLEELAETLGVAPFVRFLGNVGQDVIHEHYLRADLFVLPSFAEGVPVVLMEAMASGCPVIATRIAGIPELIEDGVTGLLVQPGRADLLAHVIERSLLNASATRRMAFAAGEKVKREFNLHISARQLALAFERHTRATVSRMAIDARNRGKEGPVRELSPRKPSAERTADAVHDSPRGAA